MNDRVEIKDRFMLTDGDKANYVWIKLLKHFNERLDLVRSKNDNPMSPEETAMIRGQIKELKYLISLGSEKKFMQ